MTQLGRIVPVKAEPGGRALVTRSSERDLDTAVLEFQSPTASLLAARVPGSARGTIWVVASLVAACGLAMGLIPIDKVVSAQGRLVSRVPNIVVQPLETSIVRAINVQEGQLVRKGEVLARLDPTFASADMGGSADQVKSLGAEVDRLRAEIAGQPYEPKEKDPATEMQQAIYLQRAAARSAMLANYEGKIDSLRATAQRAAADVQGYRERLQVASNVEDMRRKLEELQVGSKLNTAQAMDNRFEVQRNLADSQNILQGSLRDLQAQIAQRDNYVQQQRADTSQTLTEQSRKLTDAEQQLSKAQLRHQLVNLVADQDAIVLTVAHVSVGSVLQSGDQFVTLVPANAPLEVEANVPGNDAGYVSIGDTVAVKFDTFPYVRYGYETGTVRTISSDSFSTDQQQNGAGAQRSGMGTGAPAPGSTLFYRTRVALDPDHSGLHDLPAGFHLIPGMPLTADIKVGKRTVLSYLLGRVLPTLMDGMREP